jgi:PAS domain S-box-containing protein
MSSSRTQPFSKHKFLALPAIVIAVISVSETLVIVLLDALQQSGISLSPLQHDAANVVLLSVSVSALLWWLAVRPLALKVVQERRSTNRQLLEALENHVLVSIADVQGRIVYANETFCKVSGFSKHELIGQDHRIVNSGYHDREYMRNMWRTIAGGQVWRGEFCNRSKDGELYWVDSTIAPVLDKNGKPKQYISIRRDTTARKANELKLTALKRALDASSEMILITDAEGSIQYANPALCQFTGWDEEALMGQKPYVLDSLTADRQTLAEMQDRLHRSEAWSGRLRGRRRVQANGSVTDLEHDRSRSEDTLEYWAKTNITPILTENGNLSGYVQIQHDVSEQVEHEAALQVESEDTAARLAISEVLHQPLPLEQRFVQVLEILFGLKSFDQQRKGCVYLRAADDYLERFIVRGECNCMVQRLAFGEGCCGQVAVSRKLAVIDDCRDHDCPAHGHYLMPIASGEELLGVLYMCTDPYPVQSEFRMAMLNEVGEMIALALLQQQAHASLEAARDAALQAAQTKTEFLANMSHEIRTPMNGVLGMLDLLQDTQLTREQWDLLDIAANSAESLLTIINDILDFSKLEAGKIELEQIEFNLPDLVEEVCTLLSSRAHSKGLELNCFLPPNLPLRWQGDPTRIRQVLTNLIGNAVKFTERGEVSVKVSLVEKNVSGDAEEQASLRFDVIDTGIGISPETQGRLFQAFTQADSSTSRRYGGTGLGLSISKDLVVLMDGSIGVESTLGQGTNFWFTLPLKQVDSDVPEPQANFTGKRALIVDDNATNRMILNHYLSNWGFTLSETDNGPAALIELEAAVERNEPYDLLLSDMQMPDMDGFSLARAIAQKPSIAGTPRILLSSGGIGSESERLAAGFAQSLLKPVRQSQLFEAIIAALQLPARKAAPVAKDKEAVLDYSSKRVLVVEDNKVNQKVILAQLAKFQLKPDLANNGQEALDHLQRETYDLVFMDCQMPVMDGYEATRILRDREQGKRRTPVTALTAHASVGEREKCLSAGMDDYLSKPVSRAELAIVLTRWVGLPPIAEAEPDMPDDREQDSARAETKDGEFTVASWDEVAALKRLDGDHELLDEMIDLFLEEAPVQLNELAAALSQADLPALADGAHALKGMAGHFCAEHIIGLAVKLEHSARHGMDADFQAMVNDLTLAIKDLADNLLHKKQTQ